MYWELKHEKAHTLAITDTPIFGMALVWWYHPDLSAEASALLCTHVLPLLLFFFFFFFFFCVCVCIFFRAAPMAYVGS